MYIYIHMYNYIIYIYDVYITLYNIVYIYIYNCRKYGGFDTLFLL